MSTAHVEHLDIVCSTRDMYTKYPCSALQCCPDLHRWLLTTPLPGCYAGLYKPGGLDSVSEKLLQQCISSAKHRHKEVAQLLQQALEQ